MHVRANRLPSIDLRYFTIDARSHLVTAPAASCLTNPLPMLLSNTCRWIDSIIPTTSSTTITTYLLFAFLLASSPSSPSPTSPFRRFGGSYPQTHRHAVIINRLSMLAANFLFSIKSTAIRWSRAHFNPSAWSLRWLVRPASFLWLSCSVRSKRKIFQAKFVLNPLITLNRRLLLDKQSQVSLSLGRFVTRHFALARHLYLKSFRKWKQSSGRFSIQFFVNSSFLVCIGFIVQNDNYLSNHIDHRLLDVASSLPDGANSHETISARAAHHQQHISMEPKSFVHVKVR